MNFLLMKEVIDLKMFICFKTSNMSAVLVLYKALKLQDIQIFMYFIYSVKDSGYYIPCTFMS